MDEQREGGSEPAGGTDRGRDRDVLEALDAEDDALAGVEVGGRQIELAGEIGEVVRAAGLV